jgi:predicted nuclease of predicted toxin-antitoxin system
MRFLIDMNLPPEMADWLRSHGHDAVHVREVGSANLPDRKVFAQASEEGRIIVTFDLDFGEIVGLSGGAGSGVVLLRLRSVRQSYLRERLLLAVTEAEEELRAGAIVLVEDGRIRIRHLPPGS